MGLNPSFKRRKQFNFLTHSSIVALAFGGALLGSVPAFAQLAGCGVQGSSTTNIQCYPGAGAGTAGITIQAGSVIDTTGFVAGGNTVHATSVDGSATINVQGATITANSNFMLYVSSTSGFSDINLNLSGTNTLTLNAAAPAAIAADTIALVTQGGTGNSIITITGTLNASNKTLNTADPLAAERDGFEANSQHGNSIISHTGSGTISTLAGAALLSKVTGSGSSFVTVGANVVLDVTNVQGSSGGLVSGIRSKLSSATSTGTITVDSAATIRATGAEAHGIFTTAGNGKTTIINKGAITVGSNNDGGAKGIHALSVNGDIAISNSGLITSSDSSLSNAVRSGGIRAVSSGAGNITIEGTGDINMTGGMQKTLGSPAIFGSSQTGNVTVNYSGNITVGDNVDSSGIRAVVLQSGVASVNYRNGTVHVKGNNADGLYAQAEGTASASVTAENATIKTDGTLNGVVGAGFAAFGIVSSSYSGTVDVVVRNSTIDVNGRSSAIYADGDYDGNGSGAGSVTVYNNGTLISRGAAGRGGIFTKTNTGTITAVNDGKITVYGSGYGISSIAKTGSVSITNNGEIHGGWTNGTQLGTAFDMLGGTQTLVNAGVADALSDVAVSSTGASSVNISNSGTMTGYVTVTPGVMTPPAVAPAPAPVTLDNSGLWNMRNYADSDGDGVRDHYAIAVSNLGTSGNNTITNTGTIRVLGHDHKAATLDTTGMYLPHGYTFNTMSLNSPTQAHILGVNRFENNGIIDMTANSSVGDVLVITGGQTAGTNGGGTFVTGGAVMMNTVLNEGGANSQSDVLVLDNVVRGANATALYISGTGAGAVTVDNGILVVDVLGTSGTSDFALGSRVAAGLYQYDLVQVGTDWYLQSEARDETIIYPTTPGALVDLGSSMISGTFGGRLGAFGMGSRYGAGRAGFGSGTGHEGVGAGAGNGAAGGYADREVWCRDPKDPYNAKLQYRCKVQIPQEVVRDDSYKGMWGRMLGETGRQNSNNIAKYGARQDYNQFGLQAGIDLYGQDYSDGSSSLAGVYAGYQSRTTDMKGAKGATFGKIGKSAIDAYSVGAYWAYFASSGWYVDAIVQGTQYEVEYTSRHGLNATPDGYGLAASLEGGYTFKFGNGFAVEPQAQLIFQHINLDSFNDGYSRVSTDDINSTRGRLGAKFGYTGINSNTLPVSVWGVTNIWHDFTSDGKTKVNNFDGTLAGTLISPLDDTWLEVGAGMTAQMTDNVYLNMQGSYNYGLNNNDRTSWNGLIGVKVTW